MIRLLKVLVPVVLAFMVFTASANAYTVSGKGRWGGSTTPKVQGAIYPWQQSQIQFFGREVYRSKGYQGTQKITAYYKIYQWDGTTQRYLYAGGWSGGAWVRPGARLTISPKAYSVWDFRHYTVDISLYWRTPRGSLIGARHFAYVNPGDYSCESGATAGYCIIDSAGGRTALFLDGPNSIP